MSSGGGLRSTRGAVSDQRCCGWAVTFSLPSRLHSTQAALVLRPLMGITVAVPDLDSLMLAARDHADRQAYAQVVEQCHHLLRAMALRDTANGELADEVAQEALVRGWERRHQYRDGTSPKAWLLAMVRSQILDRHRRQDRDRRHLPDLIRGELLRHRDCSDEDQLQEDRLQALDQCLQTVAPQHRELLDLVHRDGLSTDDAAEIIGISSAACRQRLSRLQRSLRDCIDQRLQEKV